MRTVAEIEAEAKRLIAELAPEGYTFRWNNQRTTFGITYYGNLKRIELSKPRALHEPWEETLDTILHEIAHAIVGPGEHHGPAWRAQARRIGAVPRAVMAEPKDGLREATAQWVGRCQYGHESSHRFFRRPSREYSCSQCSPRWKPEFILTYTKEV